MTTEPQNPFQQPAPQQPYQQPVQQPWQAGYQPPAQRRRLTRTRDDKVVAGVCGGIARYLDVDATLVRVLTVVALVLGFLTPAFLYLVAWVLMPQE